MPARGEAAKGRVVIYTECPNCRSVFRVHAQALKAAHGTVRCGGCRAEFDALDHLRDEAYVIEAVRRTATEDGREQWLREPVRRAAKRLAGEMPASLREDLERHERTRRQRFRTAFGGALALVLTAGLALQAAWFHPQAAAASYPQARAAIDALCARTACNVPERRDPGAVRLLSRDVRVHPRYEGALQIRARFVNEATFSQAYPRIQFSLFNVNGQVIARRAFVPLQYLGRPPEAEERMDPGVPVEVALELLAPEEVAVSFEFLFL